MAAALMPRVFDVDTYVFHTLGFVDLGIAAVVCKRWRELAISPVLWRALVATIPAHIAKRIPYQVPGVDIRKEFLSAVGVIWCDDCGLGTTWNRTLLALCNTPSSIRPKRVKKGGGGDTGPYSVDLAMSMPFHRVVMCDGCGNMITSTVRRSTLVAMPSTASDRHDDVAGKGSDTDPETMPSTAEVTPGSLRIRVQPEHPSQGRHQHQHQRQRERQHHVHPHRHHKRQRTRRR